MKPSLVQANAFLAGELLPGVRFRHNDYVRITSGSHAGNLGSLISVDELGADPLLLIELESGQDVKAPQSAVELVESRPEL
jgi:hypothetical protein